MVKTGRKLQVFRTSGGRKMRLDFEKEKPFRKITAIEYIATHQGAFYQFLDERVRKEDWAFIIREIIRKNPVIVANLLYLNYDLDEEERIRIAIRKITQEGMLTVMLGAKRHGKTSSMLWLAERLLEQERSVHWFGYYPALKKAYPEIKQTLDITKVEDSVILIDEALLLWFGREAMTRELRERIKQLPTIGHKGNAIIFASQSLRLDPMIKDLADYIWFKPLFGYEIFESELSVNPIVKYMLPIRKNENLIFGLQTQEPFMFRNPLPSRWNDQLSKPFSKIPSKKEAREFFEKCLEVFGEREAALLLEQRGWKVSEIFESLDLEIPELDQNTARIKPKAERLEDKLTRCPKCGSLKWNRWGKRGNQQRFKCLECGAVWYK